MVGFIEEGYLFYVMTAAVMVGVASKVILYMYYRTIQNTLASMKTKRHKFIDYLKGQYVLRYQAKLGVQNVDKFVDKYVDGCKLFKINLSTWDSICGQMIGVILASGVICGFVASFYIQNLSTILSTLYMTLWTSVILLFVDIFSATSKKKEYIRSALKDYFENCFKPKLEKDFKAWYGDREFDFKAVKAAYDLVEDEKAYSKKIADEEKAKILEQKEQKKVTLSELREHKREEKVKKDEARKLEKQAKENMKLARIREDKIARARFKEAERAERMEKKNKNVIQERFDVKFNEQNEKVLLQKILNEIMLE